MDEIFLKDYANNVAVAQDPFGLEAIRAQPGFENYTPSFERTSVVNEPVSTMAFDTQTPPTDFKSLATRAAKNVATNYALDKLGISGMKANVVRNVFGVPMGFTNPVGALLTVGSFLPGPVKNIASTLRGNRAMKAIERDVKRDTQGDVQTYPTGIMAIKPTAQEAQRGNQYSGGKQNTGGAKTGGGGRKSSDFGRDFHG